MTTIQINLAVTATAETIASKLSDDELNLAAALFMQLGDTLATIAAVKALEGCKNDPAPPVQTSDK